METYSASLFLASPSGQNFSEDFSEDFSAQPAGKSAYDSYAVRSGDFDQAPPVKGRFRNSVERLNAYARDEGFELLPYQSPRLNLFSKLEAAQAVEVTNALVEYCDTLASVKEQHEPLSNNLNSVWLQLRKMGLRSAHDFFQHLRPTDVVEIYALNGLQIFRSFHFFQFCSYDLETLFCTPWYELFERDPESEAAYMGEFGRLISGQVKGMELLTIPSHLVKEKSARGLLSRATPRLVSMLHDRSGKTCAFAHVVHIGPV